jgi:hypothetical protein
MMELDGEPRKNPKTYNEAPIDGHGKGKPAPNRAPGPKCKFTVR